MQCRYETVKRERVHNWAINYSLKEKRLNRAIKVLTRWLTVVFSVQAVLFLVPVLSVGFFLGPRIYRTRTGFDMVL